MGTIYDWVRRNLSDHQVVNLLTLLVGGLVVILVFGPMLVPFFASIAIAYLLDGPVAALNRKGVPRMGAILVWFGLFLALLFLAVFWLLPLLIQQVSDLIHQLPAMIGEAQRTLLNLSERYPRILSEEILRDITGALKSEIGRQAQKLLTFSLSSVLGIITLLVYLVLMPILVFFFLKDKDFILAWVESFLPHERSLSISVWQEVNAQIANYVRGKFVEILIVWAVSTVTFMLLGLNFALLLGLLVGVSVLIPYVGAAVVTLPVALVSYFQWGLSNDFLYTMIAYGIIQLIDGNLLVTLLLSEAVNLHPVAIIAAILIFGGLWGFWGVFFAIPLATLINAVLKAWPSPEHGTSRQSSPGD